MCAANCKIYQYNCNVIHTGARHFLIYEAFFFCRILRASRVCDSSHTTSKHPFSKTMRPSASKLSKILVLDFEIVATVWYFIFILFIPLCYSGRQADYAHHTNLYALTILR